MVEEIVLENATGSPCTRFLRERLDGDAAQFQPLDGIPDVNIRPCCRGSNPISAPNIRIISRWVFAASGVFLVRCLMPLSEDGGTLKSCEDKEGGHMRWLRIWPHGTHARRDLPRPRFGSGAEGRRCREGAQKRDFSFIQRINLTPFYPFAPSGLRQYGPEDLPAERGSLFCNLRIRRR